MEKKILLEAFSKFNNLKEGPKYCYQLETNNKYPTLVISSAIHGNEIIGVNIIYKFIQNLFKSHNQPKLNYKFIIGNPEAYELNKRFIETDLNRSFCIKDPETIEEKRAKEILDFVKGADTLIDLHQTQEPSDSPFIIFNYTKDNIDLAYSVHSCLPIVTFKNGNFSGSGKGFSSSFNLVAGNSITVELGEKGIDRNQLKLGLVLISNAENYLNSHEKIITKRNIFTWEETIFKDGKNLELIKGLKNFSTLTSGQKIIKDLDSEEYIYMKDSKKILFPKYGENAKYSEELLRILKEITEEEL